jgi:hypothetical protein
MKLTLIRDILGVDYTRGNLLIDGVEFCKVIEDRDRQLERYPEAKVYGKSAIPRGTYEIRITMSTRFKRELPLLVGVFGFEGIRIHPGNTALDTEGCILPGVADTDRLDRVLKSRDTFESLFKQIRSAVDRGERVEIDVK